MTRDEPDAENHRLADQVRAGGGVGDALGSRAGEPVAAGSPQEHAAERDLAQVPAQEEEEFLRAAHGQPGVGESDHAHDRAQHAVPPQRPGQPQQAGRDRHHEDRGLLTVHGRRVPVQADGGDGGLAEEPRDRDVAGLVHQRHQEPAHALQQRRGGEQRREREADQQRQPDALARRFDRTRLGRGPRRGRRRRLGGR